MWLYNKKETRTDINQDTSELSVSVEEEELEEEGEFRNDSVVMGQ